MEYNSQQLEAITHGDGPCLVLAGPGSGKTAVITKRAEQLILHGAVPEDLLVVTFTRAAAAQMRRRFDGMTQGRYPGVLFGTFHAVFFTILKHAYQYTGANIAREETKYQFLQEIIARHRVDCEDEREFCSDILSELSAMKNGGIDVEDYYPVHCGKDVFRLIYREYDRYMKSQRLIDFDDILIYTKELLEQREDYRSAWQHKFSYIMVDEFQDINLLQYQVVKLLAGNPPNLFAVGDDDQSIYRFRGSKPELMLNFPKDYPYAHLIPLSVNYRCPGEVVKSAGRMIAFNKNRYKKTIIANKKQGSVQCKQFETVREENAAIIRLIRDYQQNGGQLGEVAVLYRTNAQAGALISRLMEYNLPFFTKERMPNIYEHWIAQDLKAYFRLAMGSRSRKEVLRIMNRPKRYLSRESLQEKTVDFDAWQGHYILQPWIAERIEQLSYDLKVLGRVTPYAAVNYIRKAIGYEEYLTEYAMERQINAEDLLQVLEELLESTRDFKTLEEWLEFTEEYRKRLLEQWNGTKRQGQQEQDAVALMTLHGAKGLEYELVILPDLNEGVIPYKKAVLDAEIEEERRMFYVGMTRAKKELHLYHVKLLRNKEAAPSRFLLEAMEQPKA